MELFAQSSMPGEMGCSELRSQRALPAEHLRVADPEGLGAGLALLSGG